MLWCLQNISNLQPTSLFQETSSSISEEPNLAFTTQYASSDNLCLATGQIQCGLRAFAVDGFSCWNELPVELRDLTVGPATFAKHLKTHLFRVGFFLMEHALLSLRNIL